MPGYPPSRRISKVFRDVVEFMYATILSLLPLYSLTLVSLTPTHRSFDIIVVLNFAKFAVASHRNTALRGVVSKIFQIVVSRFNLSSMKIKRISNQYKSKFLFLYFPPHPNIH